jgi:hypothetical protein
MLLRLVSPMRRPGSSIPQFAKRIPADIRERLIGMRLAIPLGEEAVLVTVTDKMQTIRFSLRTSDPIEVKVRQGEAISFVETVFRAVREDSPLVLTNRQANALAGMLYRAWAEGDAGPLRCGDGEG